MFATRLRSVGFLLAGLAIGTLYGVHLQTQVGAATNQCKPSAVKNTAGQHILFKAAGTAAGDQKTDTDTFHATGAFTVAWSTGIADPSTLTGYILLMLQRSDHLGLDTIGSGAGTKGYGAMPGGTTTEKHLDCSGGCYFTIQTHNMTYSVQVEQ